MEFLLNKVSKKDSNIEKNNKDDQDAKQYISNSKEDLGSFKKIMI